MKIGRKLAAAFLCAALALLDADSWAQSGGTSDVDWLKREAKADRDFSDQLADKAKSWRDLAVRARAYAKQTSDPEFQASWNKDAAYEDGQASELDHQIADLRAKAATKESQAASLSSVGASVLSTSLKVPKARAVGPTLRDSYKGQAELQRTEAARLRDYAGRWRAAERHLQGTNRRAGQAMQDSIAESVALYEQQSKTLEDQATTADQAAQTFDQMARSTPPDRPELDEQKTQMASPEGFVGRWVTTEKTSGLPEDVRIKALNITGSPPTLTLDSKRFHWVGLYDDTANPPHGRVNFSMKPSANAMNQEIPEWARKQIEGDLQWTLEVNTVDVCGPLQIKAKWYPGEVSWDDTKRKAWVTGSGNPIEVNYTFAKDPPEETDGTASVAIVSASSNDGQYTPLRAISRGLPFRIQVILPSFFGDEEGNTIRAQIKGESGTNQGRVANVALAYQPQSKVEARTFDVSLEGSKTVSGAWVYLSEPIRFTRIRGFDERAVQAVIESAIAAMKQQPPHFGVLSKGVAANEISFPTTDGETLQVSVVYGHGVAKPFLVYDNPVSFAKYQIRRALDDYEIGLRTAALGAGVDSQGVEDRLALISNARAFMNYKPAAAEVWPDYLTSEIGLIYMSLLRSSDRDVAINPTIEGVNAEGVSYRATKEKDAIEARIAAIKAARVSTYISDLKNRLDSSVDKRALANQFSYFDVEDIKIVVLGEDWSGARVDRTTQLLTGTRMGLQLFADVAGGYELTRSVQEAAATTVRQAAREEFLGATNEELPQVAKQFERAPLLEADEFLPDETNAAKPTVQEFLPDETNTAKPKASAKPQPTAAEEKAAAQQEAAARQRLNKTKYGDRSDVPVNDPNGTFPRLVTPEEATEADARKKIGGKLGLVEDQYEILNAGDETNINHAASKNAYCVKKGCTLNSVSWLLEKFKVGKVAGDTLHQFLVQTFGINVMVKGAPLTVVKDIFEKLYGAAEHQIHTYTMAKSFRFIEDGIAKGNKFVAAIRYAGSTAGKSELHAVVITNYEKLAGRELITFYDINAHAEIRMGCDLFRDKLLLRAYGQGENEIAHSLLYEVGFKK